MLLDVFINIPSLVMAEVAWCARCIFLAAIFAGVGVAGLGAIGLYVTRPQPKRRAQSNVVERLIEAQP